MGDRRSNRVSNCPFSSACSRGELSSVVGVGVLGSLCVCVCVWCGVVCVCVCVWCVWCVCVCVCVCRVGEFLVNVSHNLAAYLL